MAVSSFDGEVFPFNYAFQALPQAVPVKQIPHAKSLFHISVGVNRRDSPAGRPEFFIGKPIFFQPVQQLVVGHADGSPIADFQMFRRDFDTGFLQPLRFAVKMLGVNDDSGAKHVYRFFAKNSGRHEVHNEFAFFVDYRMTGIVSSLVTYHNIIMFGEQIDHTAFAFISPVCTYNRCQHSSSSFLNSYFGFCTDGFFVCFQKRPNLFLQKFFTLVFGHTGKCGRIGKLIQFLLCQ